MFFYEKNPIATLAFFRNFFRLCSSKWRIPLLIHSQQSVNIRPCIMTFYRTLIEAFSIVYPPFGRTEPIIRRTFLKSGQVYTIQDTPKKIYNLYVHKHFLQNTVTSFQNSANFIPLRKGNEFINKTCEWLKFHISIPYEGGTSTLILEAGYDSFSEGIFYCYD